MPLDPHVQRFLRVLAATHATDPSRLTIAQRRDGFRDLMRLSDAAPPIAGVEDGRLPGPAGPIEIRIYTPFGPAAPLPGLLWFHGGGLVTDKPDSPHLLAPKIKARMYFGIASNDDQRQPDAKDKLREAFDAAKVSAEIEVYPAKHGWCVADMPADNAGPIYSMPDAERAWGKLVALYKTALA